MSGFRNVKLNWLVGGVSGSDHLCRGRRAGCDISVPGKTLEEIGEAIRFLALPVRQVIIEKDQGVVHVSIERPLLEFLIRKLVKGKLVYLTFGESQGRAKAKAFMSRLISRIIQRRGC